MRLQSHLLALLRWKFLPGDLLRLLVWPVMGVLLGAVLWTKTLSGIDRDHQLAEQNALKNASSLARSYARFLTRTIEQMDQITMQVKYGVEKTAVPPKLEDMVQTGLFTAAQFSRVFFTNAAGLVVSSSEPIKRISTVAESDYFQFHKNNNSTALHVDFPVLQPGSLATTIHFSRRLDAFDESFAGVVVISVDASYMLSFYDELTFGRAGLLGIQDADGPLRALRLGEASSSSLLLPMAVDGQSGQRLEPSASFIDNDARFLGWQSLGAYPFIALAALSSDELLQPVASTKRAQLRFAFVASVILLLFVVVAMLFSARLSWRSHRDEELRASYRIATEGGTDGFYLLQPRYNVLGAVVDFQIIDCNERAAALYGVDKAGLLHKSLSAFYPPNYFGTVLQTFAAAMHSGFYEDEFEIPNTSPVRVKWVRRRIVHTGARLALTLQDISDTKNHETELSRLAIEDDLTGLPNRSWLMHTLAATLSRCTARGELMAVVVIGLDNFNTVNNTLGHTAGDELLRAVGIRLKSVLRPIDAAARLGGDEFALVLDALTEEQQARVVGERLILMFDSPFVLASGAVSVTGSVGIGIGPRDGTHAGSLLKNADIAMHAAKAAGSGLYRFYDPKLSETLRARRELEQALRRAMDNDEFELVYQPRVDTQTGEMCSMEALVRWQRPGYGMVSPLDFIPLAEETGMILRLGEIIMERAFIQLTQWQAQGCVLKPVSINVSARQFNEGKIELLLAGLLTRYRIAPALIEIELTESATMGDRDETLAELVAIRALGVKLFLDDFGTGYSSLSQLQRLKMDSLKVDRNFTAELCRTDEGEVFFNAIVSMAHALGMTVVAEGVETLGELRVLQRLGCDEVQGYLISKPVPAQQIPALLEARFLFTAIPGALRSI